MLLDKVKDVYQVHIIAKGVILICRGKQAGDVRFLE
jgi:hypothetical protein